ncbi:MAG: aminoacyl-tRNA hydrolase [Bacilli bacterium]|jgi:PTH1 family peptidyl-tRNA hydrolase
MKLIVGLGNPGKEYENTRHNLGFMVVDKIAEHLSIEIDCEKDGGLYGKGYYKDTKIMLLKPQQYVNLSGEVIRKYIDYYKIKLSDVLIINDDMDMDLGHIKLKHIGGTGGHKGLKNIEDNLKTTNYQRLKIGISRNKSTLSSDYVLSKFSQAEKAIIKEAIKKAVDIAIDFTQMTFLDLMNKYNQHR